jgi:hypothetical protein
MKERIDELLAEWEERRSLGETVTAADLCDCPEDEAELKRCLRILSACDRLLEVPENEDAEMPASIAGYEVRGELGRGGMGVVYRVRHPLLDRDAALKMSSSPLSLLADDCARLDQRLRQEGQALAQLEHEGIVRVHDAFVHEGRLCLVMALVPGGCLADHKDELAARGSSAVVAFMEKVARAVGFAHRQGILHRDLKPANILLAEDGSPRVSDFGLAKMLTRPEEDRASGDTVVELVALTVTGTMPGTVPYMAPEQFDPAKGPVGPTADVWALGVILYEMLAGRRPFTGKTREEVSTAVLSGSPEPLKGVGARIASVVRRCLEKDPARRYRDAEALADALAALNRRWWLPQVMVGCGAVLAAALLGWIMLSPVDPERAFERKTAPLKDRLLAGETVELIPPGETMPPYRVRSGQSVNVRKIKDGVTIAAPYLSLVELLADIPLPRYRIEAEIRHDKQIGQSTISGVGLVYAACRSASEDGTHHVLRLVRLDEFEEGKTRRRDGREVVSRMAQLHQLWFLDASEDSQIGFRSRAMRGPDWAAHYDPDAPGTWRFIRIDVEPKLATAELPGVSQERMGPLTEALDGKFRLKLFEDRKGIRGLENLPESRPLVAIFVSGGRCTVRQIRIIPMP